MARRSKKALGGECTIPPAIPTTALSDLLFKRDHDAEQAIRRYVESQSERDGDRVVHAERVNTEYAVGRKFDAWDVRTTLDRWWVITSPTNLYSQELFPSLDYTISFHVGVTARMMSMRTSGVERVEELMLASAWRKWEQAGEALDEAEEAEDFQAVGMRCRESLIAMVRKLATADMVPSGFDAPKRSDVVGWCARIAEHIAHGGSAEFVRGYLKATSKAGWQLVQWLTHTSDATQADAVMALETTQHILATFSTAMFRHLHGIPDRCPSCGSYRIGLRQHPAHRDGVPGCHACEWVGADTARTPP
jgi:hypothetical protein